MQESFGATQPFTNTMRKLETDNRAGAINVSSKSIPGAEPGRIGVAVRGRKSVKRHASCLRPGNPKAAKFCIAASRRAVTSADSPWIPCAKRKA